MCEPNTDIEPQTTDIEAGEKMQENVDKEVDTFTGDELGFEVVDMSAGEEVEVATKDVDMATKDVEVATKSLRVLRKLRVRALRLRMSRVRVLRRRVLKRLRLRRRRRWTLAMRRL